MRVTRPEFLVFALAAAYTVPKTAHDDQVVLISNDRSSRNDDHAQEPESRIMFPTMGISIHIEEAPNGLTADSLEQRECGFSGSRTASLTVYETLANLRCTTNFFDLLDEYPELSSALNDGKGHYTVFAPIDAVFAKPRERRSQYTIEVLQHHIIPHDFPISRILSTPTIPTLLQPNQLNGPQRLRLGLSLQGLTINRDARVTTGNVFATNGVIHLIDSVAFPPPPVCKVLEILLKRDFSTLQFALGHADLTKDICSASFVGATVFAPSNGAFQELGDEINAFLFSKDGKKYLRALLEYHIVLKQTLYSNAFYNTSFPNLGMEKDSWAGGFPKGFIHFDLPTLASNNSIGVDIARYGGLILMMVERSAMVGMQDIIGDDGVVHAVDRVLIPAKHPHPPFLNQKDPKSFSVEELKESLVAFVDTD